MVSDPPKRKTQENLPYTELLRSRKTSVEAQSRERLIPCDSIVSGTMVGAHSDLSLNSVSNSNFEIILLMPVT